MKKILITGGAGFIGSNLALNLCKKSNFKVTVLDNLSRKGSEKNLELMKSFDINFLNIDINDSDKITQNIRDEKYDYIFHLAAQVAMTTSIENPRLDMSTNFISTFNILESIRLHSPSSVFIYTSSNKVYGDLGWDSYDETDSRYISKTFPRGYNESTPIDFSGPYGCSKGSADFYTIDYCRTYKIKSIVLRLSTIYGPNQYTTENQGWIGWFINQALDQINSDKVVFEIAGDGKQVRDILYVDDLIDLFNLIIESKNNNIFGTAYNVGGGAENSLSINELINNFIKINISGKEHSLIFNERRLADQLVFISSNEKTNKIFGWNPKINLDKGLKKYLNWLESL